MFLNDMAYFGKNPFMDKVVSNPIGGFFLKHGDTVTRTTANGVTKKTKGLFNSGYGLRKRGMAAIGTPLAMYGGYKLKRKYDQYKPEIKMLRAYNNFKNKMQGI